MFFFQFCSQLSWYPPCRHFMELQNIMDDMVCWSMTHIQMCGYFIHSYAAIFLHDGFNCCNGLWCHNLVCLTRSKASVTEVTPFMNFLFLSYTCCSDRHASPYWTFIPRWISMGFNPSELKKTSDRKLFLFGASRKRGRHFTLLLRLNVAFLHRTATCRPLFKP